MTHNGITTYLGYDIKEGDGATIGPNGTYAGKDKFIKKKLDGVMVGNYYIGRTEEFTLKASNIIPVIFTELDLLNTDDRKAVRKRLKLKNVPEIIRGYLTGLHSYSTLFDKTVDAAKFFNPKRRIDPLFVGNNIFYTPKGFNGLHNNKYYVLTNKPYELGRNKNDALYSIVYLKEPISMITELTDKLNEELDGYDNPICVYRNNINSVIAGMLFRDNGYETLKISTMDFHRGVKPILKLSSDIPLVELLTEPGLAFRAFERLEKLDVIFTKYIKGELGKTFDVIDITDKLWENGRMVDGFKPGKKLKLLNIADRPIPFIPDIDMPSFNNLNRLGKLNPRCNIIIERESEISIRYMFVIESDIGRAFYYSYFSNRVILSALKKKSK